MAVAGGGGAAVPVAVGGQGEVCKVAHGVNTLILLGFPKIACALCHGIGAMRFDADRGGGRISMRRAGGAGGAAEQVPACACRVGFGGGAVRKWGFLSV